MVIHEAMEHGILRSKEIISYVVRSKEIISYIVS